MAQSITKKPAPRKTSTSKSNVISSSSKKTLSSKKKTLFAGVGVIAIVALGFTGYSLSQDLGANAADSAVVRVNKITALQAKVDTTTKAVEVSKPAYERDAAILATMETTQNNATTAYREAKEALANVTDAKDRAGAVAARDKAKKTYDTETSKLKAFRTTVSKELKTYNTAVAKNTAAINSLQKQKQVYAVQDEELANAKRTISLGGVATNISVSSIKAGKVSVSFNKPAGIDPERYVFGIYNADGNFFITKNSKTGFGASPSFTLNSTSLKAGSTYNIVITAWNQNKGKGEYYSAATSAPVKFTVPAKGITIKSVGE